MFPSDSTRKMHPELFYFHVGETDVLRVDCHSEMGPAAFLKFWGIMSHIMVDRRVIYMQTPLDQSH